MNEHDMIRALKGYSSTLTTLYGETIDDSIFFTAADMIENLVSKVESLERTNQALYSIISSERKCETCKNHKECINPDAPNCIICNKDECICSYCTDEGSNWEWSGV